MRTNRKLAAILFADIAGYTAMMHADEVMATRILNKYQEELKEKTTIYDGEIVKQYGDGTLILFSSAINAVNFSIEIQKAFKEAPPVPLRIGIHLGEVIENGNDYFGNDINICSRIESMGVSGGILISKDVFEKTKNQPNIEATTLGNYHFKNLPDPLEVFAISNEGMVVPNKKDIKGKFEQPTPFLEKYKFAGLILLPLFLGLTFWFNQRTTAPEPVKEGNFLLNKKIAILPFENETNDANLNVVGKMVTDWVTQTMLANKAGKLVDVSSFDAVKINTEAGYADFLKETKAEIIIKGRYFLNDDHITLTTSVTDADRNVLHAIPPLKGKKSNPINILEELQEALMSYWFLGAKHLGSKPPKYSAYKLVLSLGETWLSDYETSEKILHQALAIDSTFYRCLISLATLYDNTNQPERCDSIIQRLESNIYPLSPYEKLLLSAKKASLYSDYQTAAKINEQLYQEYNLKLRGLDALDNNNRQNHPRKTLEIVNATEDFVKLGDCYQCQGAFANRVEAYYMLGEYSEVVELIEPISDQIIDADIAVMHLRALVKLYQMDKLNKALEVYKNIDLQWFGTYNRNLLYWAICQELYLADKKQALQIYAKKMLDFASLHPDFETYEQDMFFSHFLLDEVAAALPFAKKADEKFGGFFEADVITLKVLNGDKQAGEAFLAKEKPSNLRFDGGDWEYNRAKVLTALGAKEAAINSLITAQKAGYPFLWYTFQNDIFFKSLMDEPAFQELVKVKDLEVAIAR